MSASFSEEKLDEYLSTGKTSFDYYDFAFGVATPSHEVESNFKKWLTEQMTKRGYTREGVLRLPTSYMFKKENKE